MARGVRGDYPGTWRSSKNRWGMKVWIRGELHYLGGMADRAAAADYVRLVESRYVRRVRRPRGTLTQQGRRSLSARRRWFARMPWPGRELIGRFDTRWEAERVMRRLGLR